MPKHLHVYLLLLQHYISARLILAISSCRVVSMYWQQNVYRKLRCQYEISTRSCSVTVRILTNRSDRLDWCNARFSASHILCVASLFAAAWYAIQHKSVRTTNWQICCRCAFASCFAGVGTQLVGGWKREVAGSRSLWRRDLTPNWSLNRKIAWHYIGKLQKRCKQGATASGTQVCRWSRDSTCSLVFHIRCSHFTCDPET